MTKKKHPQTSFSQEENVYAQHILEHYHQIASDLHESKDQEQAEAVLTEINSMPEGAQIILIKELAKQHDVDAADVVVAVHELSPLKTVRKEARRSLIQLEGAKIFPQWQPYIDRTPAISLIQPTTNPPRFWKGLASNKHARGQVELILLWEQGEDYKEVRTLGFFLDFPRTGVRDFFTSLDSKRNVDKFVAELLAKSELELENCSLRTGRRLLMEAIKVQTQHGTKPPLEYQSHLSLINQLVIEAEVPDLAEDTDLTDEDEDNVDLHGLSPKEVVVNFVEFWVDEEYDLAYDLLASSSSLRAGLSKDEWVERRETWANEAVPDMLEPSFIYEREQPQSKIWLPELWTVNYAATHKEVVAGWSIELEEVPEDDTLPELPDAIVVYEKTNRHWFWVSYTLVQEEGEWRIQQMANEAQNAQTLSIEELQKKHQEPDRYLDEFAEKFMPQEVMEFEEEAMNSLGELVMRVMEATCYTDVLIKKLPFDRSLYDDAADRMLTIAQYERCLVYLTPLTQRFSEQRALYLRRMADVQLTLSQKYAKEEDDEHEEFYEELAEGSLHASLDVENSFEAHMSLVELLIEHPDELDHAEEHLLAAKELMTDSDQEAHIEMHLAQIATEREQHKDALSHYQRVLELQPDVVDAWLNIGKAHEALGHLEEAENHYKRAIELEPDTINYYYALSQLYNKNNRPLDAIEAIEQGIAANPDSAILHIYLAAIYIENDDYQQAELHVSKAEQIDPESELVAGYRQILKMQKPKHTYTTHKLNQPLKQKKKRR